MIYQDYFRNSDFEDIWIILKGYYLEPEELKPLYSSLFEAIRSLPVDYASSKPTIQMCLDSDDEIMVKGAPDPQEWLLGREVEIDFSSWKGTEKRQLVREINTATLAAHLLYWSTLYDIATQGQYQQESSEWDASLEEGTASFEPMPECMKESFQRKRRKYWQETVTHDSAIHWSWNLSMLKKKLEYNIGFWRYVQPNICWKEEVNRMNIAVKLINIAENEFPRVDSKYINLRTADKYTREKDNQQYTLHKYFLTKLYRDKAYHILWKWLDHNMKSWQDSSLYDT